MTKRSDPVNPLYARCLELCQTLEERARRIRDYGTTPGNAWLAKNELQQASQLLSELENLVDEIRTTQPNER